MENTDDVFERARWFIYNDNTLLLWSILIGAVLCLFYERKVFIKIIRDRGNLDRKKLIRISKPIWTRFLYILGGIALYIGGFVVVRTIEQLISNVPYSIFNYSEKAYYQAALAGVICVIAFQLAGFVLILSAGCRWMVNLTKLIVTITVLAIFLFTVACTLKLI